MIKITLLRWITSFLFSSVRSSAIHTSKNQKTGRTTSDRRLPSNHLDVFSLDSVSFFTYFVLENMTIIRKLGYKERRHPLSFVKHQILFSDWSSENLLASMMIISFWIRWGKRDHKTEEKKERWWDLRPVKQIWQTMGPEHEGSDWLFGQMSNWEKGAARLIFNRLPFHSAVESVRREKERWGKRKRERKSE